MEYCFVAGNYPTKDRQVHVFLENVVTRLVDRGETCHVIAPQSYVAYYLKKGIRRPLTASYTTAQGNTYMVHSPLYMVLPKLKFGDVSLYDLQKWFFYRALKRTYRANHISADVIYSHFVQIGVAGVKLAKELGVASIIANGEADTIAETERHSSRVIRRTLKDVSGIISVSTKCKNEIRQLCGNDPEIMDKIEIIVNAADNQRFFKKDRKEVRRRMGWPEDAFVVVFTGSFIDRKGVMRLSEAVDRFDDVHAIFMGVGPEQPNCKNILHCGRVNNADMNDYLNAADVFVLPTRAEGCCNAIVEALLAGLPVISADREFNHDILDDSCAILIDPDNVDEIAGAIRRIKNDPALQQRLEEGAQKKAAMLSIDARVDRIEAFVSKAAINDNK